MNEKNKDDKSLDNVNSIVDDNNSNNSRSASNNRSSNGDTVWRRGYIQDNTFSNKEIQYRIHNARQFLKETLSLQNLPKK